jgi:hypothetical protein
MENNEKPLVKHQHIGRELLLAALVWIGYSAYHFWKYGIDYRSLAVGIILVATMIIGYFTLKK